MIIFILHAFTLLWMSHATLEFWIIFFFLPINAYFITRPQREREHEQSNDLNISVGTYITVKGVNLLWKLSLGVDHFSSEAVIERGLPGAPEEIIHNRKIASQTGSPAYCRKLPLWDWLAQNTCKMTNELWKRKDPSMHSLRTSAALSCQWCLSFKYLWSHYTIGKRYAYKHE